MQLAIVPTNILHLFRRAGIVHVRVLSSLVQTSTLQNVSQPQRCSVCFFMLWLVNTCQRQHLLGGLGWSSRHIQNHLPLLVFTTGWRVADDGSTLTHEAHFHSQLNLNHPFFAIIAAFFFFHSPQFPEEHVKMLISLKLLAIRQQQRRIKLFLRKGEAVKER